ncbi:MAG: hypothetical protein ACRDHN_21915 [Thermomicrobiales bacterium]
MLIPPSLAVAIGLNEAVFVQQLHYWLNESNAGRFEHGRHWIYNTYDEWLKQFPFWSIATLRRVIGGLEKDGLVLSTQDFNDHPADRTKWYSLDYDAIDAIESSLSKSTGHVIKVSSPSDQTAQLDVLTVSRSSSIQESTHEKEGPTLDPAEIDERLVELYLRDWAVEFHDDRPLGERVATVSELWRTAGCDQARFLSAMREARTRARRSVSSGKNRMPVFLVALGEALSRG